MNLQKNIKRFKLIEKFDLLSLALMFFSTLSFLLNGLYYSYQKSVILILSIVIIIIKAKRSGQLKISLDKVFYSLLAMILLNVFGFLCFVEKGMIIHSIITYLLYIFVYIMFSNLDDEDKNLLKKGYIFIVLISLIFIFVFKNQSVVIDLAYIIKGEFAGALQYSNSYALFLLITLHLLLKQKNKYKYVLSFILIMGIIFTKSHAGILFAVVYLGIYILLKAKNKSVVIITYFFIISLICFLYVSNIMGMKNLIMSFNPLKSSGFITRILYYKDSIRMIIDRPFGYGYGGYFFVQHFFQTAYDYSIRFVHSFPLQVLLDYGVFGVLAWGVIISSIFNNIERGDRLILIIVILYSLIDFHMQFGIFLIVLFLLSNSKLKIIVIKNKRFFGILLSSVIAFSIYVFSFNFLSYNGKYELASKIYPYDTILYKRYVRLADDEKLKHMTKMNPYVYFAYEELSKRALEEKDFNKALEYAKLYRYYYPMRDFKNSFYLSVLALALENDDNEALYKELLRYEEYADSLKKERNTILKLKHKFDFNLDERAKEIINRFDKDGDW